MQRWSLFLEKRGIAVHSYKKELLRLGIANNPEIDSGPHLFVLDRLVAINIAIADNTPTFVI